MNARIKFKHSEQNSLEKLFYEAQPYIYLGFAMYAFTKLSDSKLALFSAAILVWSAFMILRWRFQFRAK